VKAFTSHSNRLDAIEKAMQPKGVKLKLDGGVPADAPTPVLVKTLMGNGVPVYSSPDVASEAIGRSKAHSQCSPPRPSRRVSASGVDFASGTARYAEAQGCKGPQGVLSNPLLLAPGYVVECRQVIWTTT
jgi:hypothetical protein